ncbi:hypothetical protein WJX72_012394 [[Myrmecia] bisecta]|uniref:Uncharacterized protein n=1 Tax=[Myrmecia] bisecta TaxID=41462 RepID=A0AAW1PFB2_9CHLO
MLQDQLQASQGLCASLKEQCETASQLVWRLVGQECIQALHVEELEEENANLKQRLQAQECKFAVQLAFMQQQQALALEEQAEKHGLQLSHQLSPLKDQNHSRVPKLSPLGSAHDSPRIGTWHGE